ncbi:unnamed protein product, partial [Meganyctiphanes norvegica]
NKQLNPYHSYQGPNRHHHNNGDPQSSTKMDSDKQLFLCHNYQGPGHSHHNYQESGHSSYQVTDKQFYQYHSYQGPRHPHQSNGEPQITKEMDILYSYWQPQQYVFWDRLWAGIPMSEGQLPSIHVTVPNPQKQPLLLLLFLLVTLGTMRTSCTPGWKEETDWGTLNENS